jgi:hypothetical protein
LDFHPPIEAYDLPFEVWGYYAPYEEKELPSTIPDPDLPKRMEWLAGQRGLQSLS